MMNTECRSEMLGFAFTSAFYIGCSVFDIAVGQFIWGCYRLEELNIEYRMMNTECRSKMLGFAFTSAFYIGCSLFDISVTFE
jgi:hypothetical protein